MKKEIAEKILNQVRVTYDDIAQDFARTRQQAWPEMQQLVDQYVHKAQHVLDVGCGNGRLYGLIKDREVTYKGIDNSAGLIAQARQQFQIASDDPRFQIMDALNIDLPDSNFDMAFAIAVLHHIPSHQLRLQFLQNIKKTLKPGGMFIMTNWNLWQPRYRSTVLEYNVLKRFKQRLDRNDVFIPFGRRRKMRYIHAFTQRSLTRLLRQAGFELIDAYYVKKGEKSSRWQGFNLITIAKNL